MRTIAAPLLILLAGCATITNFVPIMGPPPRRVYGGVRLDVENLAGGHPDWWLYPLWVIDLPLSAVADTLTLPIVLLTPSSDAKAALPPGEFKGVFVFRVTKDPDLAAVRRFVGSLPGIRDVGLWQSPDDPAKNFVEARFDPSLTDRAGIAARVRERWPIAWWECPSCGRTGAAEGTCCGSAMRPGSP